MNNSIVNSCAPKFKGELSRAETLYHPVVGDVFEPHRVHQDNEIRRLRKVPHIHVPSIVAAQYEIGGIKLTDGPKRAYDYLVGRAGENGICWPSFETIASDLGKSPRQVRSDIKVLESVGLLAHDNRSSRKSNTYRFIWHNIFERQWTATQMSGKIRSISTFERQDPANLSGSVQPGNCYKESSQKSSLAACTPTSTETEFVAESRKPLLQAVQKSADQRSAEIIIESLAKHGVKYLSTANISNILALGARQGACTQDLALFIETKCNEKAARGEPSSGRVVLRPLHS